MTDEKLIITYTPKCHYIYISFTVLYLFFCSHKCMSQYLWLWNCALFHSTKLVIVGSFTYSYSSYKLYTVPRTWSILPPSSADKTLAMLLFNSYSLHFSLYSTSMYFSFEHCKLSTYCACAFQMSVYCSHTLCKLSVYCE